MIVEICAPSLVSAIHADKAGADRIELCHNLAEGGTTPSYGDIAYCVQHLRLKTHVLIRPRAGNFCYSSSEMEAIITDINICKTLGVKSIVVGFLKEDYTIDTHRLCQAVQEAGPMELTFHRAFDICSQRETALEKLIDCGCKRLLTSGFCTSAMEGRENIRKLVIQANGRIQILAGSGITADNANDLIQYTHVSEIHASCKKIVRTEPPIESANIDKSNLEYGESNFHEIQRLIKTLNKNI